jgi:hypothetical protein
MAALLSQVKKQRAPAAMKPAECPRVQRPVPFLFLKTGSNKLAQPIQRGLLVCPVGNQRYAHALHDAERKNTKKALGIDTAVILFHPDGALIGVCLLDKEGSGSGMQPNVVMNGDIARNHVFYLYSDIRKIKTRKGQKNPFLIYQYSKFGP